MEKDNNFRQKEEKDFLILSYIIFVILFTLIFGVGCFVLLTGESFDESLVNSVNDLLLDKNKLTILNRIRNLDEVNNETLDILSKNLVKDNNSLYVVKTHNTAQETDEYLKSHIYELVKLNNNYVDLGSFETVEKNDAKILNRYYFKDKKNIYYFGLNRSSNAFYTYDFIYYNLFNLENVSVESWKRFGDSDYSIDNNNVYYKYRIISEADSSSFKYLDNDFGIDKNYIYYAGSLTYLHNNSYNLNKDSFFPITKEIYYFDSGIFTDNIFGFGFKGPLQKLGVDDPSSFKIIEGYSKNKDIYKKYNISLGSTLFEDSNNYYVWDRLDKTLIKYKK